MPIFINNTENIISGLSLKTSVKLATIAALAAYTAGAGNVLTADANGALTIDGVATTNGDRVLVKDEGVLNKKYNGWYDVTDTGSPTTPWILTRSSDADNVLEMTRGEFSWVTSGGSNANTCWAISNPPVILNTDPISYSQIGDLGSLPGELNLDLNYTFTGTLKAGGKFQVKRTTTAIDYTTLEEDVYVGVTNTDVDRTITVVAAGTAGNGALLIIKDESGAASTNNITYTGADAALFDGSISGTINTNYGKVMLVCDGTNWWTV